MRFPKIADVMPLARWETVKRLLHINDNDTRPDDCTDRLAFCRQGFAEEGTWCNGLANCHDGRCRPACGQMV